MNRRTMYHAVFAALVSLASLANAQEPAAEAAPAETKPDETPKGVPAALKERYQQMAEQLQQGLPKREIKVEVVEAQKTPLLRADPKLFDNKFVAWLVLQPAGVDFANHTSVREHLRRLNSDQRELPKYPAELQQLLFLGDTSLFHLQRSLGGLRFDFDEAKQQVSDRLGLLLKQCPPELAPEKALADFLTSADCNRDVVQSVEEFHAQFRSGASIECQQLTFRVYAPSAEEAERRVRAILRLHDAGLSRPMQEFLLGLGQKRLEQARNDYEALRKLSEDLRAVSETLAKSSDISGDVFSQLKAQKVMVAVELAGLSARVKACDAMLADPKKLEIAALQSISDMKVKAEIERIGTKEKLDQINLFIAEGDARTKAGFRESELRTKATDLQAAIGHGEQSAAQYAELFTLYAPFQIPKNRLYIGPIEWTQQ